MQNVKPHQIRKCIYLTTDEYKQLETKLQLVNVFDYKLIRNKLQAYFGVKEIVSMQADDPEDTTGTYIWFKD